VKQSEGSAIVERQAAMIAELKSPKTTGRLAVKSGGSVVWLRLDEIDWIGSADNYAELHVGAKSHLLRETMGALESRLDPKISFASAVRSSSTRNASRNCTGCFMVATNWCSGRHEADLEPSLSRQVKAAWRGLRSCVRAIHHRIRAVIPQRLA